MPRLQVAEGVQCHPQILYDTFEWSMDKDEHVFILGPKDTGADLGKTNLQTPGFLQSDQTFVITEFDVEHHGGGEILSLYLGDKPQITAPLEALKRRVLPAPIVVPVRQIVSVRIQTRGTYGSARLHIIGFAVRDRC